jgi:BlaI family penicillinase repressor
MRGSMKVTNAEALIMETLWREAPLTADQMLARLKDQKWSMRTAKTLIGRLLRKGAISSQLDGRRYLYTPVLKRADYIEAESNGLVERLFGGNLSPLLMHFGETKKYTAEDIEVIKGIIVELEKGGR